MSRFLTLTILTLLLGCSTANSDEQPGKSRNEQLKEIPYRGEIISDSISNEITRTIKKVVELANDLNKVSIYYLTEGRKLERLNGDWSNGKEALKQANQLWKDIDLTMTIVLYPSYSQDAVTGETNELWVIQFDHKGVSRTCRVFFDSPTPTAIPELDC